jgi:glutaredoxin/glutathione-dependent peroxiredoxin
VDHRGFAQRGEAAALDLAIGGGYRRAGAAAPRGARKFEIEKERTMAIKVGDTIPEATLIKATEAGPQPVTTAELFGGRTVALFSVPGAFTPTCSAKHLPGFVEHAAAMHAKGVDEIACLSVNDAFVMTAWGKSAGVDGKVTMLADGSADFTRALGLEMDASRFGMGMRGQRFSMIVTDGKVTQLNLEDPGAFAVSSAEHLMSQLA